MSIELWMIGRTKEKFLQDGINEYSKRLSRQLKLSQFTIPVIKNASKLRPAELKKQEAVIILKKLGVKDYLVLLDERGQSMDSRNFAKLLEERMTLSAQRTIFLIGGAYGFDASVYDRSNLQLSLSKMTFSHQMIRLVFWEQLYRGISIIKGLPYHND